VKKRQGRGLRNEKEGVASPSRGRVEDDCRGETYFAEHERRSGGVEDLSEKKG